jgi:hypothetical protein
MLSHETFFAIAGKFPPAEALQIARTLTDEPSGAQLDIRYAQLSVTEVLAARGDEEQDVGSTSRAAAELLHRKQQREERLRELQLTTAEQKLSDTRAKLLRKERELEESEKERDRLRASVAI